jgi:hypothetical protein
VPELGLEASPILVGHRCVGSFRTYQGFVPSLAYLGQYTQPLSGPPYPPLRCIFVLLFVVINFFQFCIIFIYFYIFLFSRP